MDSLIQALPQILHNLTPVQLFVVVIVGASFGILAFVIWILVRIITVHFTKTNEALNALAAVVKTVGDQGVQSAQTNKETAQMMASALTSALLTSSIAGKVNMNPAPPMSGQTNANNN